MVVSTVYEACPECGGRGWLVVPDGGAGTARPCDCRKQNYQFGLLAAARIPERYQNCRISSFQIKGSSEVQGQMLRARFVAQRYVNDFLSLRNEIGGRAGLLLMGPPGVGKTHLAVSILIEVIEKYAIAGRFVELNEFVGQMKATFERTAPETMQQVIEPVVEAPLLVLDELGSQKQTPWLNDLLYLIVNTRYTRRLPTIFTTNYRLVEESQSPVRKKTQPIKFENLDRGRDPEPPPEPRHQSKEEQRGPELLSWRIPSMLISRLYEMAEFVSLDAVKDYRQEFRRNPGGP
ncbi:MAG TPA: ATP-binding protein [Thermoanaerobaculia bacterium]